VVLGDPEQVEVGVRFHACAPLRGVMTSRLARVGAVEKSAGRSAADHHPDRGLEPDEDVDPSGSRPSYLTRATLDGFA
jgi:hypothetical protein